MEDKVKTQFMKFLRDESLFVNHPFNVSKEYLVFDDGSSLELGIDCIAVRKPNGRIYYKLKEDNKWEIIDMKTCTLTYGINLHNVIVLLERKNCKILNIIRSNVQNEYGGSFLKNHYKIVFTNPSNGKDYIYEYSEYGGLNEFMYSDLGHYLMTLYGYEVK